MSWNALVRALAASVTLFAIDVTASDHSRNVPFGSACGPRCTYAALRAMGIAVGFDDVARECAWLDGDTISVEQIEHVLRKRSEIVVAVGKADTRTLESHLDSGGVAILFVARQSRLLNHALCVLDRNNDGFRCVDLPGATRRIAPRRLEQEWSGEAIFVSYSSAHRLHSEWPYLILPTGASVVSIMLLIRVIRSKFIQADCQRAEP